MRNFIAGLLLGTVVLASVAAQSDTRPFTEGRSACTPFDPATLKLVEVKKSVRWWSLRRGDGAMLKAFANLEDAEAGLAVAKRYTQLCHIGKSNARPDRQRYIMEYWK